MATHSSTLAWKIAWIEEPGRLQFMESLRLGHDWATSFSLLCIGERNGNPVQCSCLENARDGGACWLPSMGSYRVGHDWSDLIAVAAALQWTRWMEQVKQSWILVTKMNTCSFLKLQIIVLRLAVNRFPATIEGVFTIGNNYLFSEEVIWKLYVNSFRSVKEHTVEQTAKKAVLKVSIKFTQFFLLTRYPFILHFDCPMCAPWLT